METCNWHTKTKMMTQAGIIVKKNQGMIGPPYGRVERKKTAEIHPHR